MVNSTAGFAASSNRALAEFLASAPARDLAIDTDRLVWKLILDWIVVHRGGERFVLTYRESPGAVVGGCYICPDAMSEHSTL